MVGRTSVKSNFISLVLFLFSTSAYADEIRVIDGDTLNINDERIRLWGIDAPEIRQKCGGFACGVIASLYLESIITGEVTCEKQDTDRYGRTVAKCFVAGRDLGAIMVENGWALDYEKYSKGFYSDQQNQAETSDRGIWRWDFIPPWEWRQSKK